MRLWSPHPKYLDTKGLVALRREALLAKKVLVGGTTGYTHHPQLVRFRDTKDPLGTICTYLRAVYEEATTRGFSFDREKIDAPLSTILLEVTDGQIAYERQHLLQKLSQRDTEKYDELINTHEIIAHPLFMILPGDVAPWEKNKIIKKSHRQEV